MRYLASHASDVPFWINDSLPWHFSTQHSLLSWFSSTTHVNASSYWLLGPLMDSTWTTSGFGSKNGKSAWERSQYYRYVTWRSETSVLTESASPLIITITMITDLWKIEEQTSALFLGWLDCNIQILKLIVSQQSLAEYSLCKAIMENEREENVKQVRPLVIGLNANL